MSTPDLAGDRLANPYPPVAVRLTDEQVNSRLTWTGLDGEWPADAAAQIIHVVPSGSSTVTVVNPVDPDPDGYRKVPWTSYSRPRPAGRKGC